jgi:hypothetical protein
MSQRKAVTVIKTRADARGGRQEKVRILDELGRTDGLEPGLCATGPA